MRAKSSLSGGAARRALSRMKWWREKRRGNLNPRRTTINQTIVSSFWPSAFIMGWRRFSGFDLSGWRCYVLFTTSVRIFVPVNKPPKLKSRVRVMTSPRASPSKAV